MRRAILLAFTFYSAVASATPVRVCVIGNSISEGFSPATRGWSSYLVAAHVKAGEDFSAKNVAESGDKVANAQTVFDRELAGSRLRGCTHVAFLIGTNDLPDGTAAATIYATINTMASSVETQGRTALLLKILPRGTGASWSTGLQTRLEALNALLAARAGSTVVDTYTALQGTCAASPSAPAWAGNTAYVLNDVRVNGGIAYGVTTAGTSAASGGPTGTGTGITDGTVVWSSVPCIASSAGGATDGLHLNNTGEALIATTVDCAADAAGLWTAAPSSLPCP